MIKTILILSSLFAGITSFAGQSTPVSRITNHSGLPVNCTITIIMGNMQIRTTAANCKTTATTAQLINFDTPSIEGGGTFPESNLSYPYLQP